MNSLSPAQCSRRVAMPGFSVSSKSVKRRPKWAAMPRFRKKKPATTLTEAVRRILTRAASGKKPFAVFMVAGRILISNTETERFFALERRWPEALVGTYTKEVNVEFLIRDLREYFADDQLKFDAEPLK